jgi:hypothetical protein
MSPRITEIRGSFTRIRSFTLSGITQISEFFRVRFAWNPSNQNRVQWSLSSGRHRRVALEPTIAANRSESAASVSEGANASERTALLPP